MKFLVKILLISVFSNPLLASELGVVKKMFAKYWSADSVFMEVEKKTIIGLLEKTTVSHGRLLFAKGNVRIDFTNPEASTLIFNDKKIILIKSIKQGLNNKTLVTIVDRKKAQKQHALMGLMFGDKKVWNKLKLVNSSTKNNLVSLHFKPKKAENLTDIEKVAVVYNKSSHEIKAIKQWDTSENETQFIFSNMIFDMNFTKNYFKYKMNKSDEVTYL